MRSADAQADPTSRRFWRLGLAQQLRQLGDVGGDAPGLVGVRRRPAERRSSPSK
jgi:hypothetical protein